MCYNPNIKTVYMVGTDRLEDMCYEAVLYMTREGGSEIQVQPGIVPWVTRVIT
jgi:hypothetical protein